LAGTAHLTPAARGVYIDLLSWAWAANKPLPRSEEARCQLARVTSLEAFRAIWAELADKWVETEDGYHNAVLERTRSGLERFRESQRLKGVRSGETRRQRTRFEPGCQPGSNPVGNPIELSNLDSRYKDQDHRAEPVGSTPAPTKALLKAFDVLHQAKTGERAVIRPGKDAKLVAALCRTHGPERVRTLMEAFFASSDPFIQQAGYTVGVFHSQAGKLIAQARAPTRAEPVYSMDWWEECKAKHGGACNGRLAHANQMAIDADRVVAR